MSPLPKNEKRVELRAPADDVKQWREAADRERMTLSDWVRRACNAAASVGKRKGK